MIVVDNGSSDATASVVDHFRAEMPVRRILQPVAGLSNARNAGVDDARGLYIVWTDDDVVVPPDWLSIWADAVQQEPSHAMYGGSASPVFEEPKVQWFVDGSSHLRALLAVRDDGQWQSITPDQLPYGLHFVIRTDEQRRHRYDPSLGVAPGRRRGGEELAVINAILAEGGTGKWIWDATLSHMIPAERQTAKYIAIFYRANGYDHPIWGISTNPIKRMLRLARSIASLLRISVKLKRRRKPDASYARDLVIQARAIGSIRRHSGLGE
jgi:glycosyltransferase involved in cell wall biosynthesis